VQWVLGDMTASSLAFSHEESLKVLSLTGVTVVKTKHCMMCLHALLSLAVTALQHYSTDLFTTKQFRHLGQGGGLSRMANWQWKFSAVIGHVMGVYWVHHLHAKYSLLMVICLYLRCICAD